MSERTKKVLFDAWDSIIPILGRQLEKGEPLKVALALVEVYDEYLEYKKAGATI